MDSTRKISFLVFVLCVFISLKNQINKASSSSSLYSSSSSYSSSYTEDSVDPPPSTSAYTTTTASTFSSPSNIFYSVKKVDKKYAEAFDEIQPLQYDFYRDTCPGAEQIVRSSVRQIHQLRPDISPALLRLVFHDCFIEVYYLFLLCIYMYYLV